MAFKCEINLETAKTMPNTPELSHTTACLALKTKQSSGSASRQTRLGEQSNPRGKIGTPALYSQFLQLPTLCTHRQT